MTTESDALLAKIALAADNIKKDAAALNAMVTTTTTPPTDPPTDPPTTPPTTPTDPPAGTKLIYVSASIGSDSGGNGSITNPYRSIPKAFANMPSGVPAWVLLKSGDTFPTSFIEYAGYGGKSTTERHLLGAWGTVGPGAKPKITGQLKLGVGAHPMNFFTLRDIEFPNKGVQQYGYGNDIIHENLTMVGGNTTGLIIQAETESKRLKNLVVRKCLIADLAGVGQTHAIYVWGVDGLTIEDNVIDRAISPIDIFCHHLYIQAGNTSVTVRRNVLARGASSNEFRCGGTWHDNLMLFMPNGLVLGCGAGTELVPGGVVGNVRHNVHLGGGNIGASAAGKAMNIGNIKSGEITDNVIADGTGDFQRVCNVETGKGVGCLNMNYHHNTRRNWAGGVTLDPGGNTTGSTFTQTGEMTGPFAGADLALNSFGYSDLYTALRNGEISGVQVIAMVRSRLGLAP